jgi:hypothetical protein
VCNVPFARRDVRYNWAVTTGTAGRALAAVVVSILALGGSARADELAAIQKAAPTCDVTRDSCFAIQLHIASSDAGLVAGADWLKAQLVGANRHFAALGVGFTLAGVDTMPDSAMHIETRADRNALAVGRLRGRIIHVFIVGQLDDVDVEGSIAYGVTWRLPNDKRKFIIVSAQALERTLAHELGHFFGLPHSTYAVSIMNKTERKEPPVEQRTFADDEIAAMRPVLERLVRAKVIVAVKR